jgi:hypothetical protein
LDARKSNLQLLTKSDVTILNREPSIKRLIGVRRADPPAMAQVRLRIPFVNQHRRQEISSRSFKTLEEKRLRVRRSCDPHLRRQGHDKPFPWLHLGEGSEDEGVSASSRGSAATC